MPGLCQCRVGRHPVRGLPFPLSRPQAPPVASGSPGAASSLCPSHTAARASDILSMFPCKTFIPPLTAAPSQTASGTHLLQLLLVLNGAPGVVRAVPLALGPANFHGD